MPSGFMCLYVFVIGLISLLADEPSSVAIGLLLSLFLCTYVVSISLILLILLHSFHCYLHCTSTLLSSFLPTGFYGFNETGFTVFNG